MFVEKPAVAQSGFFSRMHSLVAVSKDVRQLNYAERGRLGEKWPVKQLSCACLATALHFFPAMPTAFLPSIHQEPMGKGSPSDLLLLTDWQADTYVYTPQTKKLENSQHIFLLSLL